MSRARPSGGTVTRRSSGGKGDDVGLRHLADHAAMAEALPVARRKLDPALAEAIEPRQPSERLAGMPAPELVPGPAVAQPDPQAAARLREIGQLHRRAVGLGQHPQRWAARDGAADADDLAVAGLDPLAERFPKLPDSLQDGGLAAAVAADEQQPLARFLGERPAPVGDVARQRLHAVQVEASDVHGSPLPVRAAFSICEAGLGRKKGVDSLPHRPIIPLCRFKRAIEAHDGDDGRQPGITPDAARAIGAGSSRAGSRDGGIGNRRPGV